MTTATRLLAGLILILAASCGTTVPALADTPTNVRDGVAGELDAGWVRAACATNAHCVKCRLGYPEGAKRVTLTIRLGGRVMAVERTFPYRDDHRATPAPQRAASGRVVDGVRLACTSAGQRVTCTLDLAARYVDGNVTSYVDGWNYCGLRYEGATL